jgi:hypothetical protein
MYSLPTASYDTAFFEYSVRSGSNARAGTIMAIQSGSAVNFTETITTLEKIQLFKNAETVVGSIGGGMANSLFSPSSVRTAVIVSPTFLEVNERFKHCFSGVDVMFAMKSRHISADPLKKFMRVSTCDSRVGEIYEIEGDFVTVSCAKNRVAGWNNSLTYEKHIYTRSQLAALDQGLNSEWECDIDEVLECLK